MAGFSFVEPLHGTFYKLDDPTREYPIALHIEAHVRSLRSLVASIVGRVHAEGFADAPIQGTVDFRAARDRRVPYQVVFVGGDGATYRLRGEKDFSWLAPVQTLVELPFTIAPVSSDRDGTLVEIARGTVRFDRKKFSTLARSVRAAIF